MYQILDHIHQTIKRTFPNLYFLSLAGHILLLCNGRHRPKTLIPDLCICVLQSVCPKYKYKCKNICVWDLYICVQQSVCPKFKYKNKNICVSDLCICVLQSVCPPNPWVIHHSLPHDCSPAGFLFLSTKGFSSTNVTRAWSNISTNIMEIWNK